MARTHEEINNQLKSNYVGNSFIQQLYGITPGNTFDQEFAMLSFERVLFYIISYSIWVLELNHDELEQKVETKIEESRSWNLPNMVQDALSFQLGDEVVFINGNFQYAAQNDAAQIVKLANATEVGSGIILKVATFSGEDVVEISPTQLLAFGEYMSYMKPPGVNLQIVSRPADLLKLFAQIYVNPLVINTNGELISDTSIRPVDNVIKAFIKSLPFNGVFSLISLQDAIQQIPGVVAPFIDSAEAKFGLLDYAVINHFYVPNSGYLKIDPAFELNTTINYLVQ